MSEGVPCIWMRGGTSRGGYFLAADLPEDRDAFLLEVMGSPDPRQIDGLGGGDPLTSKVAVISPSGRKGVDVDYLFLQVMVEEARVTDAQNCGNILAGVGPFAIERGLVAARDGVTPVRILMRNTGQIAEARVTTPGGRVRYGGAARIDGVPGTAAPVEIAFEDVAGSTCGALLPTGRAVEEVAGIACTLIDNGMPVVVMAAADLGLAGDEAPQALEGDATLRARLETIRLEAGRRMGLGDAGPLSVPKLTLVSPPRGEGVVTTRSFIPHRCHRAIGVFGAVSVATACLLPEGPARDAARLPAPDARGRLALSVEHPGGEMTIVAEMEAGRMRSAAVLRTARKLMEGRVFRREVA